MLWHIAAVALAIVHLAFIAFVILGGLLVLRWPRLAWVHLPAAIWGALIEFAHWWCPLTKWENACLRRAGKAGYDTGFVEHYLMPVIYPAGMTREIEIMIGALVLIVNAAVYVRVLR